LKRLMGLESSTFSMGARLVENRSTHAVEDLHLTAQPVGEAETKNAVPDNGGLSDVGCQANHRSGSIGWSDSPARARRRFSRGSSSRSSAQASTNQLAAREGALGHLDRVDPNLGVACA
jgi:hypothetical protein